MTQLVTPTPIPVLVACAESNEDGQEIVEVRLTFPPIFRRFFREFDSTSDAFQSWLELFLSTVSDKISADLRDTLNGVTTDASHLFRDSPRAVLERIIQDLE